MARPISDEELQLKKRARRRLVGAIVLVTAVAVILPMVLDSEPRPVSQNVEIQIPSPDSGEFKPKAVAAAPGTASAPRVADTSPIKGMPPAAMTKPAESQAKAEPAAEPKTADPAPHEAPKAAVVEPKPEHREPAKAAKAVEHDTNGAYVVQVAALADTSRAKQLQKQMTGAGVKTYTDVVNTKAGELTRVRAGPYSTKEAAENARSQLKKAGLDGKVVPK